MGGMEAKRALALAFLRVGRKISHSLADMPVGRKGEVRR